MKARLLVAVPRPLRTLLTYALQENAPPVAAGCRVVVPLGSTRSVGLVIQTQAIDTTPSPEVAEYTIKAIHTVLDEIPLLDSHLLTLVQWTAQYYQHPLGEVAFAALPAALRTGNLLPDTTRWRAIAQPDATIRLKRAKRQAELYQAMLHPADTPSADMAYDYDAVALRRMAGVNWQTYLRGLQDKQLITPVTSAPCSFAAVPNAAQALWQLTAAQQACLDQCRAWNALATPRPILLQGVTGSGKTEIYLRLIEEQIAAAKQTLLLVPEIGLTPQLMRRFHDHFPHQMIVCLHSGLNDTERLNAWLQARTQQASIILGTRSAVFTPCPALGLIIVDEEHDVSFKQQEGFRYHGRDLAIKRAQLLNIPILLGSATPALESLYNAQGGRYHHTLLTQRPGLVRAPRIEVQDIRGQTLNAGLSQATLHVLQTTLARQEQVMLFINRRGFAPVLLCPSCGWQAICTSCSANMTFHARHSRLICHHCSHETVANSHCPSCHHPQLVTQGLGTERIELMLGQHFPDTPVVRIDRDSTSRKGALQQQLAQVQTQQRLLLVGTQMLAKGHDFPNLTLVVILDADQSLLSAEYHALERFGQLITQVAGRAGRSHKAGQVILQTTQPQHPILLTLLESGYSRFAQQLLAERHRWQMPPFSYQALLRADAFSMEAALETLQQIRLLLASTPEVQLLGPVPAPLEKRAGRYRAQLLLQCARRDIRHACLQLLTFGTKNLRNQNGSRWSIDIDPVELT